MGFIVEGTYKDGSSIKTYNDGINAALGTINDLLEMPHHKDEIATVSIRAGEWKEFDARKN